MTTYAITFTEKSGLNGKMATVDADFYKTNDGFVSFYKHQREYSRTDSSVLANYDELVISYNSEFILWVVKQKEYTDDEIISQLDLVE